MRRPILIAGLLIALAGGGVIAWQQHTDTRTAPPARSETGAGPAVLTAVAESRDVPVRKRAIGFVESPAVVSIHSRIDSQIVEQHITEGQAVKKGDLLFVLDDRDLQAQFARDQAALSRDQAILERTQADLDRARKLMSTSASTQQAVDQATSDEKAAAATIEADKAALDADRLRIGYARITSPVDGRAGAVPVGPGNLVSAGSGPALVTLTQMQPLRVVFSLPEADLPDLRRLIATDQPAVVRAWIAGQTSAPPAVGSLSFLNSAVDVASGTVTVKATFPNADGALWPGQYVDVELEVGVLRSVATVPTVAVQQGQSGRFVYVLKPDSTIEKRSVAVALVDGDRTALSSGIVAGEKVVVEGQLRIRNGMKVREAPSPAEAAPAPKAPLSSSLPGAQNAAAAAAGGTL